MPETRDTLSTPLSSSQEDQAAVRELVLTKRGHRYVFRCVQGQEYQLLAHLATAAQDRDSELTWFDAAMISHQMGPAFRQALAAIRHAGQG